MVKAKPVDFPGAPAESLTHPQLVLRFPNSLTPFESRIQGLYALEYRRETEAVERVSG
jgi:hypothetical protein